MDTLKKSNLPSLYSPSPDSHKGQNGRLLILGGSKLFHASIFFSADVASKIVDLVHFSSPANENNDLVRSKLKAGFWNGIVVDWSEIDYYINEDDCILIGPGMPRVEGEQSGDLNTGEITNQLLEKYPDKRWVIDGGALQEVDLKLLNGNMIITPHHGEWDRLQLKTQNSKLNDEIKNLISFSTSHNNLTILLKGQVDYVCQGDKIVKVEGGNPGMTKGGTGDVLAGLVAALYCKNDAWTSATWASLVNKQAGDKLHQTVDTYFNAADLVGQVPKTLNQLSL